MEESVESAGNREIMPSKNVQPAQSLNARENTASLGNVKMPLSRSTASFFRAEETGEVWRQIMQTLVGPGKEFWLHPESSDS